MPQRIGVGPDALAVFEALNGKADPALFSLGSGVA
jgi:hypothetical protein